MGSVFVANFQAMTNFVPIFPLALVVYPGERLNLHIFEPRYKQLIRECVDEHKPFGVPAMINGKLQDHGTLIEVVSVKKQYQNGEMDIVTRGIQVLRILEIIDDVPGKLYAGAIVHYPVNHTSGNPVLMQGILKGVRKLHALMRVNRKFSKPDDALNVFDLAHFSGLSLEEEYELLCLSHERQRQEYLRLHLEKVLPIADRLDRLKARANMNGHFLMPGLPGFKKE